MKRLLLIVPIIFGLSASSALSATSSEEHALSLLKAMTSFVSAQDVIALTFDSSIEVITPDLEKIQFNNSGSAELLRPNLIKAHRQNGYSDVSMVFDGKTVSIHGAHNSSYAQFEAEGTIDQLLHSMREGHAIALPGTDLLVTDSYETLSADILEAKYLGRGFVGGRECEHLAFRNFDTDWQLWIETGEQPIPRKMVITSKTMNSAPQYTLHVTGWDSEPTFGADHFIFEVPANASQVGKDELDEFDELPPEHE